MSNQAKSKSLKILGISSVFLMGASCALAGTPTSLVNNNQGLSPKLLKMGLNAYQYAKEHGKVTKPYLTIVDFNIPSDQKRLWVIDLKNDKIIDHTLVAQGVGTGVDQAVNFSNTPNSKASSLGVFVTANTYTGHDGHSLRIVGLEKGINSNALSRDIVFHPAWYVSKSFAKDNDRVGNSWGCFALSKTEAPKVINTIKDGSVVFAYATPENSDPAVNS